MNFQVVLLVVIVIMICPSVLCKSKVVLEKNAYKGLVIAINPSVRENPTLLEEIKAVFTDASQDLFLATKERAFFQEITVLVPKAWTGNYPEANDETYDSADVRVAGKSRTFGDLPHTRQNGGCGEPGEHIHLTPDFISNPELSDDYGPKGKAVVHEWAHYRWGVFDEYAKSEQEKFYLDTNGKAQATRCPKAIKGLIRKVIDNKRIVSCDYDTDTKLPVGNCRLIPFRRQHQDLSTSIMSDNTLNGVTTFCHSDPSDPTNVHNADAKNEQNRLCNLRSAWDVILDSDDFKNGTNQKNSSIRDTTPTFTVVKAKPERFVLVMDVSPSMRGKRYNDMRESAELFISNYVGDGVFIGLVEFGRSANILKELTIVNYGDGSRESLVERLPTGFIGATGVGNGIKKGLEVLEGSSTFNASGGNLVVLTDGQETTRPYIAEVADEVIQKEVKVHSILFGITNVNVNQDLVQLSINTGGRWYIANDGVKSPELFDIFQTISHSQDGNIVTESVHISSTVLSLKPGDIINSTAAIDSTVGNRTVFAFSWLDDSFPPIIMLKSPQSNCIYSNRPNDTTLTYCADNPIHSVEEAFKTIKFLIPNTAEFGNWEYSVSADVTEDVTVTVVSTPANADIPPVTVNSGLKITDITGVEPAVVFAEVSQGFTPIVGAKVTAQITTPLENIVTKELFDSGSGADVRKNDGAYSRFFTEFDAQGRYSVKVLIVKDAGASESITTSSSGAPFNYGVIQEDGSFQANPNGLKNLPPQGTIQPIVAGPLERVASSGGLQYTGDVSDQDVHPPNQITDFEVSQFDLDDASAGIVLEFTAPGDDYDEGNASYYEIRFTYGTPDFLLTNFSDNLLINESHVIRGNLSQPQPALTREIIVVVLHSVPENITSLRVAFAIRAFDGTGNPSLPSNVVAITFFFEPPPPPPTTPTTTRGLPDSTSVEESTSSAEESTSSAEESTPSAEESTSSAKRSWNFSNLAILGTMLLGILETMIY